MSYVIKKNNIEVVQKLLKNEFVFPKDLLVVSAKFLSYGMYEVLRSWDLLNHNGKYFDYNFFEVSYKNHSNCCFCPHHFLHKLSSNEEFKKKITLGDVENALKYVSEVGDHLTFIVLWNFYEGKNISVSNYIFNCFNKNSSTEQGRKNIIKFLIENDVDLSYHFHNVIQLYDIDLIKLFCNHFMNKIDLKTPILSNAFNEACSENKLEIVKLMMSIESSFVNFFHSYVYESQIIFINPVYSALIKDNIELLKLLIKNGAKFIEPTTFIENYFVHLSPEMFTYLIDEKLINLKDKEIFNCIMTKDNNEKVLDIVMEYILKN